MAVAGWVFLTWEKIWMYHWQKEILLPLPIGYAEASTGKKFFELTNHLGNVLATVSDRKTGVDTNGDGIDDYYTADVVSVNDYYLFGMMMPGRKLNNVSLSEVEG